MIGIVTGKLIESTPPQVTILCNGVGYELDMPISHIAQLPGAGDNVHLFTTQIIREDAHLLFGFITKSARDCFRQLIKVSGIGPKIALALLSSMNSQDLYQAIEEADINILCLTPGIGKKMAERMVLELKGKLIYSGEMITGGTQGLAIARLSDNSIRKDITHALESLGYNAKEIGQVIQQLPELNDLSHGIKEALKLLSKQPV